MSSAVRDPLEGDIPYVDGEQIEEDEEEEEEDVPIGAYEDEIYESESPSESGTESLTWISWFCSLPGHEYFAEVGEDFIEDDFNLTGLNALVPFYKEALEMILDVEPPEEDSLKIPDVSIVESSAELLYGLIHQRYILTRHGMQQMVEKYEAGHFGYCPRVFCHSHPVLPCGRSDLPGLDTVKLFCPNCVDNYSPPSSRFHGVDGAFFGTTFPHLLYQCYRDLFPSIIAPKPTSDVGDHQITLGPQPTPSTTEETATPAEPEVHRTIHPDQLGKRVPYSRIYTPKIYGFKVSEYAKTGPRMKWMRMRPTALDQLDRV
ncbi:Casein kinase II, regulatory subunit [Kalmanozyma brasiliensis GHG001]|uniref:Casein kinase II, regulatory subunit n=1 Tax=Kalmanozyma brasiliensis (strain GHG001) TaxID=1365824 RepID=UPI0028680EAE|nr:Casein kinase II, regulatory subunit [Kalmanozyma brasiliensis GHG001]EST06307.2 Casein kinase II, regulatory subunit [Kalmanozyma brasiliensis GHG001]